jgi:hypothetical protein
MIRRKRQDVGATDEYVGIEAHPWRPESLYPRPALILKRKPNVSSGRLRARSVVPVGARNRDVFPRRLTGDGRRRSGPGVIEGSHHPDLAAILRSNWLLMQNGTGPSPSVVLAAGSLAVASRAVWTLIFQAVRQLTGDASNRARPAADDDQRHCSNLSSAGPHLIRRGRCWRLHINNPTPSITSLR